MRSVEDKEEWFTEICQLGPPRPRAKLHGRSRGYYGRGITTQPTAGRCGRVLGRAADQRARTVTKVTGILNYLTKGSKS